MNEKTIAEKYIELLEKQIAYLEMISKFPMVFTFHGYTEKELEEIFKVFGTEIDLFMLKQRLK